MARLVLERETRHGAHDETDVIVVEQGRLSLDRLQRTACQGALGCLWDDGKGKHATILDPSRAMGRCNVCQARFAKRLPLARLQKLPISENDRRRAVVGDRSRKGTAIARPVRNLVPGKGFKPSTFGL